MTEELGPHGAVQENKITQTDIVNSKMLNSFATYLEEKGAPVNIPPEPQYEEPSAWEDED